jgi:chaperonin GroEL (HSP60 family)
MAGLSDEEMAIAGYKKVFDYTQFSHENHVNVIPEESFKNLVRDTFTTVADVLRNTYGPYGSTIMISDQNNTTTTKDGYNIYCALGFNHQYKKMVYLAIKDIIERVNRTVGDGTTSCILLAEKVFNKLVPLMNTAENKRHLKEVLDNIELELQESNAIDRDFRDGTILPMTYDSLRNIIKVASNYDMKLVDMMMEALMPEMDFNNEVQNIRNIIVDSSTTTYETISNANYEIHPLPGYYRARINMDYEFALAMNEPEEFKVLMYDHTFGASEWANFEKVYDKASKIVIMARSFSRTFMDNEYTRYLRGTQLTKTPVGVYLIEVKGRYVQDELHDLAAVLNVPLRDVQNLNVVWDEIPTAKLSVYNYNCLCVYDCKAPEEYIKKLQVEHDNETSYVKQTLLNDRINALSLGQRDTIIRVKAGTQLELKMINDKIDDCVAIVKSAFDHGVVPNMLWYGCERISRINVRERRKHDYSGISELTMKVCTAIEESIEELCGDIWHSKYNDPDDKSQETKLKILRKKFYTSESPDYSFDIITDGLVDMVELPTSAQYDLEVLVATLSIVKYLLTSRALIFDAFLLQPQGDQGHFVRDDT